MANEYKKAALCLHGLHEADRSWLLAQLPDAHRSELSTMLEELETLGIPKEPALLPGIDGGQTSPSLARSETQVTASYIGELEGADPALIRRALQDESDAVVAALMGMRDWPWRRALLEGWKRSRRDSLSNEAARKQGLLTERASSAMLQILARRLKELEATEARPSTGPVLSRDRSRSGVTSRRVRWRL